MRGKGTWQQSRLLFFSPWLLAAAVGILALIVVTFAVNNLHREKRLVAVNLLHKGRSLARFVGAGARASMMMGRPDGGQIQHLIEEATADRDIVYIAVVDSAGRVLAHSDARRVGQPLGRDIALLQGLAADGGAHFVSLSVAGKEERVFEVVRPFAPLRHGHGRGRFRFPGMGRGTEAAANRLATTTNGTACPSAAGEGGNRPGGRADDWCRLLDASGSSGLLVLVGLDPAEQETLVRQGRFHLAAMSVALLLVGAGGWLSLFVFQGYRVARETLKHVQAFAGLLIGRLPVGVIATDEAGMIKTCNPVAVALLGKGGEGVVGAAPEEVLPAALAEFFAGPGPADEWLNREVALSGGGDRELSLRVSSVPVVEEGKEKITGRVVLLDDVTELKGLEARIRRHEQLAALGKMAAGVAHEVRNPLSSIKGFATLLGAKFAAGSEEHESARLLVSEVERLNRSITELLNYARPLPLQPVPVEVGIAVEESLKLVRADADALGVTVATGIAGDLPSVLADPDRLSQVLLNLLLNALQAMTDGGTLTVTAGPGQAPGMVDIVLRDTGPGIPEAVRDRVCDPYFTTKAGGVGLGLAMVVKIVDEHRGALRIDSREGEGTTVTVSLPAAA